jgi:hypothetical protein
MLDVRMCGAHDQRAARRQSAQQVQQRLAGIGVDPVQVVDDQNCRNRLVDDVDQFGAGSRRIRGRLRRCPTGGAPDLVDDPEPNRRLVGRTAHPHPRRLRVRGEERTDERGLADPWIAEHEHSSRRGGARFGKGALQDAQLLLATHERMTVRRHCVVRLAPQPGYRLCRPMCARMGRPPPATGMTAQIVAAAALLCAAKGWSKASGSTRRSW